MIGQLLELPPGQLVGDPDWERTKDGSAGGEDIALLAGTMAPERGVLEPIRIYQQAGAYCISSGHRRWIAAIIAGLESVPCYVVDAPTDDTQRHVDRLIANVQRKDLTDIERGRGLQAIMAANPALTQDAVGKLVGMSQANVAKLIRLLKLPTEVQAMINRGELSGVVGYILLQITSPEYDAQGPTGRGAAEMQAEYARWAIETNTSYHRMREVLASYLEKQARYIQQYERKHKTIVPPSTLFDTKEGQGGRRTIMEKALEREAPRLYQDSRGEALAEARTNHRQVLRDRNAVATRTIDQVLGYSTGTQELSLELLRIAALLALEGSKIYDGRVVLVQRIYDAENVDDLLELLGFIARHALTLDDECRRVAGPELARLYAEVALNVNNHIERALSEAELVGGRKREVAA